MTVPIVGEDMKKLDPSFSVGGNEKMVQSLENSVVFLKKLNIYLPYVPEILLVKYLPKRN